MLFSDVCACYAHCLGNIVAICVCEFMIYVISVCMFVDYHLFYVDYISTTTMGVVLFFEVCSFAYFVLLLNYIEF